MNMTLRSRLATIGALLASFVFGCSPTTKTAPTDDEVQRSIS